MKVKHGIWTPNAKIVCVACHGRRVNRGFGNIHMIPESDLYPQDLEEGNGITNCDKCGEPVQIEDGMALEHKLAAKLRFHGISAEMWQTGGMNSACGIDKDSEDQYALVTYNWDGDNMFYLGNYNSEGEWVEADDYSTKHFDEMVEFILKMKGLKRIKTEEEVQRDLMLEAIKQFVKSAQHLRDKWVEGIPESLENLLAEQYPIEKSFDEFTYDLVGWMESIELAKN